MKKYILLILLLSLLPSDSHSQWVQQSIPVNKAIVGIEFVNADTGWACTNYAPENDTSYLLYTENGGANWTIRYRFTGGDMVDLDMVDAMTGYVSGYEVSGQGNVVYKTTNGGINWTLTGLTGTFGVGDIQFLNSDTGYACGIAGFDLWSTTNGGVSWIQRAAELNDRPFRVFFFDYNTGYCGAQDKLYKTTNAGVNWNLLQDFSTNVASIFFLNPDTGWIGGGGGGGNGTQWTINGGINWTAGLGASGGFEITFVNEKIGWATKNSGSIIKTIDGGKNWLNQNLPNTSIIAREVFALDSNHVWCGSIFHTSNGGTTSISLNNGNIPDSYMLKQNYPNPFNPSTTIEFGMMNSSSIDLIVYDVLGRERYLYNDYKVNSGSYKVEFNGSDLSSGIYYYRLNIKDQTGYLTYTDVKKMVLVK